MQTTEMVAGEELDNLIEQRGHGYLWVTNPKGASGWAVNCNTVGEPLGPRLTDLEKWDGVWVDPQTPLYSTDIAAAWPLVEELHLWVFPHNDKWYAGIEDICMYVDIEIGVVDGYLAHMVPADTAPLAICLAALDATPSSLSTLS